MPNEDTLTTSQLEVFHLFKLIVTSQDFPKCQKMAMVALSNSLFAAGRMPVRFISEKALEQRESVKNYRPCYEHYHGRSQSAELIAKAILKGKSDRFVQGLIRSRMRGHYTTSEENTLLKKYGHLPWRQAYEAAGIKLVEWIPTPARKFDYIIEGNEYTSPTEAADKYGLTVSGLDYRCKSDNFPDWIRKPIGE